jgi:hypothetical protein
MDNDGCSKNTIKNIYSLSTQNTKLHCSQGTENPLRNYNLTASSQDKLHSIWNMSFHEDEKPSKNEKLTTVNKVQCE